MTHDDSRLDMRQGDQDIGGGASAEEAAVHVVDDPDGSDDGPLR